MTRDWYEFFWLAGPTPTEAAKNEYLPRCIDFIVNWLYQMDNEHVLIVFIVAVFYRNSTHFLYANLCIICTWMPMIVRKT